jgi:hypothetical protein
MDIERVQLRTPILSRVVRFATNDGYRALSRRGALFGEGVSGRAGSVHPLRDEEGYGMVSDGSMILIETGVWG